MISTIIWTELTPERDIFIYILLPVFLSMIFIFILKKYKNNLSISFFSFFYISFSSLLILLLSVFIGGYYNGSTMDFDKSKWNTNIDENLSFNQFMVQDLMSSHMYIGMPYNDLVELIGEGGVDNWSPRHSVIFNYEEKDNNTFKNKSEDFRIYHITHPLDGFYHGRSLYVLLDNDDKLIDFKYIKF